MDIGSLEGTWRIQKAIIGGKELKGEAFLVFKANKFERLAQGDIWKRDFQLISTGEDIQRLDIYPQTDPYRGELLRGIIKLEGNILSICHSAPHEKRPLNFSSPTGTRTVVSISIKEE